MSPQREPKRLRILYHAMVELELPDGHAIHTHEICEHLARRGHDVLLLCPRPRAALPYAHSYKIAGIPFFGFTIPRLLPHFVLCLCRLLYAVLAFRPDVIVDKNTGLNPFPELVAFLSGLPFFVEINGCALDEFRAMPAPRRLAYRTVEYAKFSLAIRGLAVSPLHNARYAAAYRLPARKFRAFDNGVAERFFAPADADTTARLRKAWGVPPERFLLGYAGSFHFDHDMPTFVDAVARLHGDGVPVHAVLLGKGARLDETARRVRALGLDGIVTFVGPVPYDTVHACMQAFDCGVILMEPARAEALASVMKVKEYVACGIPVLASACSGEIGGLRPFIAQAAVGDAAGVAAAVRTIMEDRSAAVRRAQAGRRYVQERYSWDATSRQYVAILRA